MPDLGPLAQEPAGVVVVGGSAGSVEALARLLDRLPPGFGLPVVVVVHQPRRRPSALAEALAPHGPLAVEQAQDKVPLQAGAVFVAPPDYHLLVERGGFLALSVDEPVNYSRPSIDVLFESAADAYGPRTIGVVLSGANADGARGLAAVCRAGGVALVQSPEEASSPEMPRAALAECPRAQVLSIERIAARLAPAPDCPGGAPPS